MGYKIYNLNHGRDTVHRGWLTVSRGWLTVERGWLTVERGRVALDRGWVRWSALERGRFLVFDMSKTRKSLGGSVAVDSAVQHGWTRSSTVEHGRETVEIRYTAVVSTALYRVQPQPDGTEALHKIQGYQGHQNVSKRRPHHSGDICTTRGNNLKTICKTNIYFGGILGALRGSSMIRLNLSCFPAILSPISMYMWNKEAIW